MGVTDVFGIDEDYVSREQLFLYLKVEKLLGIDLTDTFDLKINSI